MRLLRGLLPLAATATLVAAALPATAATGSPAARHPDPWWLDALHLPAGLRDAAAAGHGVTVAVLSTGVDASYPDLAGSVTSGPDFSHTGRKPGSEYWGQEGTAVASLIAGHGHGGRAQGMTGTLGITGVAPAARILSVQVTLEYDDPLNADPAVTRRLPGAIAEGIRYAVGHGATVIALPLDPGTLGVASGSAETAAAGGSAAEQSAIRYALARDVLLIAPAGDNGAEGNAVNYPAGYPGVIVVGATARNGRLAPFSGTHSYVGLTAPGSGNTPASPVPGGTAADPAAGLTVAAPGGGYQSLASTDMSAGLTAGVAALVRSRYPWLTVTQVTQALEHSATAPAGAPAGAAAGAANGRGHGAVDATAALAAAAAIAAAHPAPPSSSSPSGPASPGPSGPAPAQAGRPAVSAAASAATPRPQDPGHLHRSLVVDLAVAAAALISCLICAIALIRLRRRRARAASRAGAPPAVPGPPPARARHARKHPDPAQPPSPPPAPRTPVPSVDLAAGAGRPRASAESASRPGTDAVPPIAEAQSRHPAQEEPPWPPAPPPGHLVTPEAFLPAEPTLPTEPRQPAGRGQPGEPPLAPWDMFPADFARREDGQLLWDVSSTGPMFVWNPTAATSPLSIVRDDADDPADDGAAG